MATPTETTALTGRLILNLVASRRIGEDEEIRTYPTPDTTQITYSGHRVRTVSVRAEQFAGEEGFDVLERIRLGIGQDDTRASLNAAGVALARSSDVQNVNVNAGNRAISVAQFDVELNQWVTNTVTQTQAGYIESVVTTGQNDLAVAGMDTITST